MTSFKDLLVYQKSVELAMEIFEISKSFPVEEKYSLIDQIRRSSRSVSSNVAEAYRKRQYPAHFISKLTDADMENSETQVWLDLAFKCGYLKKEDHRNFTDRCEEGGRLLNHMMTHPQKYGSKN